jgi:hypothetical protein
VNIKAVKCHGVKKFLSFFLFLLPGFIAANIDKLEAHSSHTSRKWFFAFALVSGVLGVAIKIFVGFLQFDLRVQREIEDFINPQMAPLEDSPEAKQAYQREVIEPFMKEFIASRPQPFRAIAGRIMKPLGQDVLTPFRNAAFLTQRIMLMLWAQIISLGVAWLFLGYELLWRHK